MERFHTLIKFARENPCYNVSNNLVAFLGMDGSATKILKSISDTLDVKCQVKFAILIRPHFHYKLDLTTSLYEAGKYKESTNKKTKETDRHFRHQVSLSSKKKPHINYVK